MPSGAKGECRIRVPANRFGSTFLCRKHTNIHIRTFIHIHALALAHTHTHTTCTYTYLYTYTNTYTCTCTHTGRDAAQGAGHRGGTAAEY